MLGRKGQFNIEYLVALIVFVGIIIFLSVQLANAVPQLHTDSVSNRLRAQAFRTTDILMKTPGQPANWEASSAAAFGFATRPYELNRTKMAAFNSACVSDYAATKSTLGLDVRTDFQAFALVNNSVVIDCGQRRVPLEASQTILRRTGFTPAGELVELIFTVWTS